MTTVYHGRTYFNYLESPSGASTWFTFALAVIASAVVLYVPGYFAARALRISRFSAVVVAPAFSLFFLVLLGIILQKAAISCPAIALFAAATAIGVVAYIASAIAGKATGAVACTELAEGASSTHDPESARRLVKTAALYIGVALIMTVAVFLLSIDGPNSFSRNDDTTVHLAVVAGSSTLAHIPRLLRDRSSTKDRQAVFTLPPGT